jgi:ATP-dependent Lon protease
VRAEREVARLARKSLRKILEGKEKSVTITPKTSADLPVCPSIAMASPLEENRSPAQSPVWRGPKWAANCSPSKAVPGKGAVRTTGKLGEVMSERQMAVGFVDAQPGLLASSPRSSSARTSTSTFLKAPCPRTGRARASAW